MTEHQTMVVKHVRNCERCGLSRTIETGSAAAAPGFTGWASLQTEALFGRFSSLGRGPYDLCPACTLTLIEWWRGNDSQPEA